MNNPPKYVKMGHTALRLNGSSYFRDAGHWAVEFEEKDGKLVAKTDHPYLGHANGVELIECTEEEWRNDNRGYV